MRGGISAAIKSTASDQGGSLKRWRNWQRGGISKHGDSGWKGGIWDSTLEGVVSLPPPQPPPYQFPKEEEQQSRGKLKKFIAAVDFFVRGIIEMGETEALDKSWLVGRCGGRGGVYGDGNGGKLYYLPPDLNSDNFPPPFGIQTPDQPERGDQEPQLWITRGQDAVEEKEDI